MARIIKDTITGKEIIIENVDRFTGESFNAEIVDTWYDGTPMDDSKVAGDNVIYFKINPTKTGGSGYAKRIIDERISILSFGAKGDGITDNTPFFNKALNITNRIYIPDGNYLFKSQVLSDNIDSLDVLVNNKAFFNIDINYPQGEGNALFRIINKTKLVWNGGNFNGRRNELIPEITSGQNSIQILQLFNNDSVEVKDTVIIDAPSGCIGINTCNNVVVVNNKIINPMFHGINTTRCSNVLIDKNEIIGPGDMGTDPIAGGIGVLVTLCEDVTIQKNIITNIADTGTKTEGCNNVTYQNNIVRRCGKDGIKVQDYSTGSTPVYHVKNARIINNIVEKLFPWRNDGTACIVLHKCDSFDISNNFINGSLLDSDDGAEEGIRVVNYDSTINNDGIISGNIIKNVKGEGMLLARINNCKVSNNEIAWEALSNNRAFSLENINNVSFSENAITYNDTLGSTTDAVAFSFSGINKNISITETTIENSYAGVYFGIPADYGINDFLEFTNNIVLGTRSYAIRISGNGVSEINIVDFSNNIIKNANAGNNGFGAIHIDSNNLTIGFLDLKNTYVTLAATAVSKGALSTVSTNGIIGVIDMSNFNTLNSSFISLLMTYNEILGAPISGTTAQRPTKVKRGFTYLDTTIVKLIVWGGSNWLDSNGTIV